MDIDYAESSNWIFDYGLDDISPISAGVFPEPLTAIADFRWPSPPLGFPSDVSSEMDCSFGDSESVKDPGPSKRSRPESYGASGSKSSREKLRREKLNERFLELGSILEPGRPAKGDKAAILSDAVRTVTQLRSEVQKLKESSKELEVKIKELKAEKNEIRDEKHRLKMEKEKLEQQVKARSAHPGFMPHPSAMQAAFAAQAKAAGNKLMPLIGYPGFAMWQVMSPAVVDTSQDHVLRPPVA